MLLKNKLGKHNTICKENKSMKNNNDLGKSNKDTLVKTVNDQEFSKLFTVKVTLDRNIVDKYFKSNESISERGISNLSQTSKIFNNNATLNIASEINTSQKTNNKKALKQTTMLQFFNIKPINETKSLHITTNVIRNNKNSPNKAVGNRESTTREVTSSVSKTPVITKSKKLLNNSSPEITGK